MSRADTAGLSELERGVAPGRAPSGVRGFLAILAFWMCFPALAGAFLVLFAHELPARDVLWFVAAAAVIATAWAVVTVAVFRLTAHLDLEDTRPSKRNLVLLLTGILTTAIVGLISVAAFTLLAPSLPDGTADEPLGRILGRLAMPNLLIYTAIAATGVARNASRRARARHEEAIRLHAQLAEARLQVLHTQLNPHFLFNTLNAVSGLMDEDPRGARRMIARLSELLRYALQEAKAPEIPLHEELALVRRYLEIVEIRYQGCLETAITMDAELGDALVPSLILQPLAENAMKHGVAKAGGQGRIDVDVARAGPRLVLRVTDTGAGSGSEASPDGGAGDGVGLGLRHTRERLRELYAADQRLDLEPRPGGGMVAVIELPYHTVPVSRPASPANRP